MRLFLLILLVSPLALANDLDALIPGAPTLDFDQANELCVPNGISRESMVSCRAVRNENVRSALKGVVETIYRLYQRDYHSTELGNSKWSQFYESQRRWKLYVEAQCSLVESICGNSGVMCSGLSEGCVSDMAEQRASELWQSFCTKSSLYVHEMPPDRNLWTEEDVRRNKIDSELELLCDRSNPNPSLKADGPDGPPP